MMLFNVIYVNSQEKRSKYDKVCQSLIGGKKLVDIPHVLDVYGTIQNPIVDHHFPYQNQSIWR